WTDDRATELRTAVSGGPAARRWLCWASRAVTGREVAGWRLRPGSEGLERILYLGRRGTYQDRSYPGAGAGLPRHAGHARLDGLRWPARYWATQGGRDGLCLRRGRGCWGGGVPECQAQGLPCGG